MGRSVVNRRGNVRRFHSVWRVVSLELVVETDLQTDLVQYKIRPRTGTIIKMQTSNGEKQHNIN